MFHQGTQFLNITIQEIIGKMYFEVAENKVMFF